MQFMQLRIEAWKIQDFNGVWTCDLTIPVRRSNQPSYEVTEVGSWAFVGSNEPMRNACEVIYEYFIYWTADVKSNKLHDPRCYERNLFILFFWKASVQTLSFFNLSTVVI